jgi:hypothetical protein
MCIILLLSLFYLKSMNKTLKYIGLLVFVLIFTTTGIMITPVHADSNQWLNSGINIYSNTTGNVGIGTTNPTSALTINANSGPYVAKFNSTSTYARLFLNGGNSASGADVIFASNGVSKYGIFNLGGGGDLGFYPNDGSTPALLLKNNGNVGIGTTNPTAPLTIEVDNIGGSTGSNSSNLVYSNALVLQNTTPATFFKEQNSPMISLVDQSWDPMQNKSFPVTWSLSVQGFNTPGSGGVLAAIVNKPSGTTIPFAIDEGGRFMIGGNFIGQNFVNHDVILGSNPGAGDVVVGWPENGISNNFHVNGNTILDGKLNINGALYVKINDVYSVPASSSASCSTGEIRVSASYIYVCVATNTWGRSALTAW